MDARRSPAVEFEAIVGFGEVKGLLPITAGRFCVGRTLEGGGRVVGFFPTNTVAGFAFGGFGFATLLPERAADIAEDEEDEVAPAAFS